MGREIQRTVGRQASSLSRSRDRRGVTRNDDSSTRDEASGERRVVCTVGRARWLLVALGSGRGGVRRARQKRERAEASPFSVSAARATVGCSVCSPRLAFGVAVSVAGLTGSGARRRNRGRRRRARKAAAAAADQRTSGTAHTQHRDRQDNSKRRKSTRDTIGRRRKQREAGASAHAGRTQRRQQAARTEDWHTQAGTRNNRRNATRMQLKLQRSGVAPWTPLPGSSASCRLLFAAPSARVQRLTRTRLVHVRCAT